jgi:GalNAc-alpha-(1->4)-GalNAc-alpha-(1->3)-diNAcBac-PP-undecaprenol alpha-1,4-N-acetyl-D-galactosaminyltransferase
MKILFIIQSLNFGGAERVVSVLSNHLVTKHKVSLVILSNEDPKYGISSDLIRLNSPVSKNIFVKFFLVIKRILLIRDVLVKKSPDIVISFMESSNIPSIFATLLLSQRKKLIVSVRNNPSSFPWFYKLAIMTLYGLPFQVVAPSRGIASQLEKMIIRHKKVTFIPNPIDIEKIKKLSYQPINFSFNMPKKYILGVGRLENQKAFDRLIMIFSKICIKNLYLIIAGNGALLEDLKSLTVKLGIEEKVIFTGTVTNPFYLYKNALCLVLTSRYEGWPNIINEAIASSCPVVSYDCKYGPSEILIHKNGILVAENDEAGMIEAIESINKNVILQQQIVSNGNKHINKFSVDRISNQWLSIAKK